MLLYQRPRTLTNKLLFRKGTCARGAEGGPVRSLSEQLKIVTSLTADLKNRKSKFGVFLPAIQKLNQCGVHFFESLILHPMATISYTQLPIRSINIVPDAMDRSREDREVLLTKDK